MSDNPQSLREVSEAPPQAQHLDFLDGLRGIAALFVVVHHAYQQTWPTEMYPDAMPGKVVDALLGWLRYGHFSVTFFITLSGFCLMIPVIRSGSLRGGTKGFLLGRVRRILPPYYAALLLSIFVVWKILQFPSHTWYDFSLPMTAKGILAHVFLIQNLHWSSYEINGPLWSIATEFQIYLLFPCLVWLWARRGIVPVLALTAALSTVLCLLVQGGHLRMLTPQYVFIFSLGMFAALQAFRYAGGPQSAGAIRIFTVIGGISAALTGLIIWAQWHDMSTEAVLDILVGFASACLLIIVTRNERGLIRRLASWPPLVWVGGFSFSLYLIHFPLQQLFWQFFVQPNHLDRLEGFGLVALVGTGTILLISFGFYQLFERPFMHSRPKGLALKPASSWKEETVPPVLAS